MEQSSIFTVIFLVVMKFFHFSLGLIKAQEGMPGALWEKGNDEMSLGG